MYTFSTAERKEFELFCKMHSQNNYFYLKRQEEFSTILCTLALATYFSCELVDKRVLKKKKKLLCTIYFLEIVYNHLDFGDLTSAAFLVKERKCCTPVS